MENVFRIRELRKNAAFTQAELAERLGLRSPSTITMWESGERKPPSTVLPQLADMLGCSIQELYAAKKQSVDLVDMS